jgi:hypothetical protein
MNAIILSREDAKLLGNKWMGKYWPAEPLLEHGTPGLSWLQLVPDEVLAYLYDKVCYYGDPIAQAIVEQRRKNLKSTKD